MIIYAVAFFCVICMAIGQILFKISATCFLSNGSIFAIKPLAIFLSTLCLYGITSLAWVWVLQRVELGRTYPLMALAFVLVPIGSHFVFGERFQTQYFIGVCMIVAGIVIAAKS